MAISEDIRSGILIRLDSLLPNVPKYIESIEQGFQEPCFFVMQLDGSQTKELNSRYTRATMFDVHYFPVHTSLTKKAECIAMAEQLYDQLETIMIGASTKRGLSLRHEVVDDVLHFFISFSTRLIKTKATETKMQELDQEAGLK